MFFMLPAAGSVTTHAVFDVSDALAQMFGFDPVRLVFVTSVAGVARQVAVDVAGGTGCRVLAGQRKEPCMVEPGRSPSRRRMALGAIGADIAMEGRGGRGVAGRAQGLQGWGQGVVRKCRPAAKAE